MRMIKITSYCAVSLLILLFLTPKLGIVPQHHARQAQTSNKGVWHEMLKGAMWRILYHERSSN